MRLNKFFLWPNQLLILLFGLIILLSSSCQKEEVLDENAYYRLDPDMTIRFFMEDSLGGLLPFFRGYTGDGVLVGYHVDSVVVYNELQQEVSKYREYDQENWYFPSIYYANNYSWGIQDTFENVRNFYIRMGGNLIDSLQVRFKFAYESNSDEKFWLDYAQFYYNSQFVLESHDYQARLNLVFQVAAA